MKETPKNPSAFLSLLPLIVLVLMLVATVRAYGSDSLSGASQVTLLVVSAFCVLIGMCFLKVPWKKFEEAIVFNITNVATAVIILLLIGALSGAWMVSGVVPSLIYYGVQIIHPDVFLVSSCIISAMVSVMTGSSWTTIATIGIASWASVVRRDSTTDGLQGPSSVEPISVTKSLPCPTPQSWLLAASTFRSFSTFAIWSSPHCPPS